MNSIIIVITLFSAIVVTAQEISYNELIFPTTPIIDFKAMQKQEQSLLDDTYPYIQMIDASSKIPNGIMGGSIYDFGNFDECYNIKTEEFYGKYCLGSISLPTGFSYKNIYINSSDIVKQKRMSVHPQTFDGALQILLSVGVCAPSTMSAEQINAITIATINEANCYSKDKRPDGLSSAAIATICIFALVVGIAVVQTTYDVYLYYAQQKPIHELLIAFSFLTNGKKLITASTNPDQLLCLNGIRGLSMFWVVIGHVFSNCMNAPVANVFDSYLWMNDVGNMYIMGATVSVDTFFLAGGLVTVYTFMKSMDKGVKFNIVLYYIHRYLRLTPALGAVILIIRNLMPYIEPSPLYTSLITSQVDLCTNDWWKSILYIGNYFPFGEGNCVGQGWYLNVDMQLFVLSPIVLLLLAKWPKPALYGIYALIIAGCVVPFTISYVREFGSMTDPKFFTDYYIQTYTRFGPYVIGMLFGYIIFQHKKNKSPLHLSKTVVCLAWLFSLAVLISCVYAGHDVFVGVETNKVANAFYLGLNRQAWSAAVGVVIYLCVFGYGGPIDSFLSLYIFQIITKLSYSIYLIHYSLISARYLLLKSPITFSPLNLFHMFWGDFMFSFILAVPFCLLFESPIIILEKYIFGRSTPTPKKN